MLLSMNWLRDFVPYEGTAETLGARLTLLGLELEDITRPYEGIADIVVGRVLTCAAHPQSDHLHVCTVDVGEGEPLAIVCGAPNVAAGQKVPVAKVGVTMPGGLLIKAAKLRGEPSLGMICSERELGLTEDHSGIMILPESFKVGERLVDSLGLDSEVLEIGITPNRGDCLSILGLARETALAFGLPLTLPALNLHEEGDDWTGNFALNVAESALCPAYRLRRVEGISVRPANNKIRYRLHAMGVRPISNAVDVTNYILMELGQPLHAFDADKVEGNGIIVSPAKAGEKILSLDGQERILTPGDLLIRDTVKPVGIAGVMGGLNSEIVDSTRNVLIECAVFQPQSIRRTGRRLGLSSESSYRFERGVDQTGCVYALDRAAALMAELTGGTVRRGIAGGDNKVWTAPVVRFRPARCTALLGVELPETFCRDTFTRLGCEVKNDAAEWTVTTPGWRPDLTREADLIEEAARVYGMDTLPETLPPVSRVLERYGDPESTYDFILRVKHWACGCGLNEAENYSFVGDKDLDILDLPKDNRIGIMNPLSEEQNVLRTVLCAGLLGTVRHNLARGNTSLRLFEVANTFTADAASETTARETPHLAMILHGPLRDAQWPDVDRDADYTDIRGLVDHFLGFLHLPQSGCERMESHSWLSPAVQIWVNGEAVGVMGRVRPAMADAFHARKPVWAAELNLNSLRRLHDATRVRFVPLPVFPATSRDITVMAPTTLSVTAVLDRLREAGLKFMENCALVDIFEPEGKDERNLTFRLVFRHPERTLKDGEVDKERERAATLLVKELGDSGVRI